MKSAVFVAILSVILSVSRPAVAQQNVAQAVDVLDEKLKRLTAQVEDLQFRQERIQQDLQKIQSDLQDMRHAAGSGVSEKDLQALEARVQALDAARQKDKQIIIDQLAKELAAIGSPKPGPKPTSSASASAMVAEAKEHIVAKGESLTSIAKAHGVSVEDLKKANNIANANEIKVGQKLIVPRSD
jgi:LysM repeat protein